MTEKIDRFSGKTDFGAKNVNAYKKLQKPIALIRRMVYSKATVQLNYQRLHENVSTYKNNCRYGVVKA